MAGKSEAVDSDEDAEAPAKKSALPLILGLVLALAGAGGGFFATFSGLLAPSGAEAEAPEAASVAEPLAPIAFVPLDPIIISLRSKGQATYLRFRAQLEVDTGREEEVTQLIPRILDVLNTYLRAVDIDEIERPSALMSLRAQMLRRIQIVTGNGRVKDLLVTEFVVN